MQGDREIQSPTGDPPEQPIGAAEVAALYVEHGGELRRFILGVLRDRDLANDVLQATFIKAVQKGHESRAESRKAWLFRVAFHEALVLKRRQQTHQKATLHLARLPRRGSENPEESVVRGEVVEQVRAALACLPPEQRDVVQKRIYEEKPFAAIAEDLGVPLGTVLTRMRLGLKKLKTKIEGE